MPPVQNYFIIREATTGAVRIVHRVKDSAMGAFNELIAEGDFDECIELMELVVNDRGRVFAEAVLYSYSKVGRYVVSHVVTPTLRPVPVRPLICWPGTPGKQGTAAGETPPGLEL